MHEVHWSSAVRFYLSFILVNYDLDFECEGQFVKNAGSCSYGIMQIRYWS